MNNSNTLLQQSLDSSACNRKEQINIVTESSTSTPTKALQFHYTAETTTTTKRPRSSFKVPESAFVIKLVDGKEMFSCTYPECTNVYSRRGTNAKEHWLRHVDKSNKYDCSYCSKSFSKASNRVRHERQFHESSI
jgi:hypothetical protein